MASPIIASGNVQLNYGALNKTETFSTTLTDLVYADEFKNFNHADRRVLAAADDTLERGNIALGKIGLLMIKNLCLFGDLHVDLNYVSPWVADLVIPAGGVNVVHSAQTGSQPIMFRCPLGATPVNVTSVATNGDIIFDSGLARPCTAIMQRTSSTGGTGSGTDYYLVKISEANKGIVYDLGGNNTVDLNTDSIYTSTTQVSITPHIDYRTIVTEM